MKKAIKKLDGTELMGRRIKLCEVLKDILDPKIKQFETPLSLCHFSDVCHGVVSGSRRMWRRKQTF